METENEIFNVIDNLYSELEDSKSGLKGDLVTVDGLKSKIDAMFPETVNARNKYFLEDKLKAFSEIFSTSLRIKQEINKTIIHQIKIKEHNKPKDKNRMLSINELRAIADEVEKVDN